MTDELLNLTRELLSMTTEELLGAYFSMESRDEDIGLLPEEAEEMKLIKEIIYHRTGTDPLGYMRHLTEENKKQAWHNRRRQPWHRH